MGGQNGLDEPVFLWVEDTNIYGAVEKAFDYLAREHGIRKRTDRRLLSGRGDHQLHGDGHGEYAGPSGLPKEARLCGGGNAIEAELAPGAFAWYQILPFDGDGTFLGLSEKYAGFAAVEDMYVTRRGMGRVITEQGPVRFVCAGKPGKACATGLR